MARKRSAPTAGDSASSELGTGNYATDYTSTGRAIRSCRTKAPQPMQESQDSLGDDDYDNMSDEIAVAPLRRKKKRTQSNSPTRELPSDIDLEAAGMSSDDISAERQTESPTQSRQALAGHSTINLTINIPLNHKGIITLCLDPTNLTSVTNQSNEAPIHARSKPRSKLTGFLDLPAELKNDIYRAVLVAPGPLSFGSPGAAFGRTSSLLRTCRQVYDEGRSILYSENSFTIDRRHDRYGSLWKGDWQELGYLSVRKFFKSIGPGNTALIRHLTLRLEDAVPCLNSATLSNEERRFVNDEELLSVLRHLVQHSQLQRLTLHLGGRKRVDRGDDRFLDYMRRIRADSVEFVSYPPDIWYGKESKQEECVKKSLLAACTRKHKKFDR